MEGMTFVQAERLVEAIEKHNELMREQNDELKEISHKLERIVGGIYDIE